MSVDDSVISSKPVVVDGAEFVLSCAKVWVAPRKRGRSRNDLSLTITNRSAKSQTFSLFDTIRIVLKDAGGKALHDIGGRNGMKPGTTTTQPLVKGESYVVRLPAFLAEKNGAWHVQGDDGFGGIWLFDGLRPGKYSLSAHYDSTQFTDRSRSVWRGSARTQPVEIEVR